VCASESEGEEGEQRRVFRHVRTKKNERINNAFRITPSSYQNNNQKDLLITRWDEDLNRKVDVAEAVAEDTPRNKSKRRIGEHNKREKEEAKTKKRAMMMTMKKTHHPETRKKKKKKMMTMVRRLSR
jgi:hypothetical protein